MLTLYMYTTQASKNREKHPHTPQTHQPADRQEVSHVTKQMAALPSYEAEMLYIEPWQGKKEAPYYRTNPDPGFETKNYDWIPYKVDVQDCRSCRDDFTLDDHAFTFVDDAAGAAPELLQAIRDINVDKIEKQYYPAVEALVKRKTGADKVIIFNHSIRKRDPAEGFFGSPGKQQPGRTVRGCVFGFTMGGFMLMFGGGGLGAL